MSEAKIQIHLFESGTQVTPKRDFERSSLSPLGYGDNRSMHNTSDGSQIYTVKKPKDNKQSKFRNHNPIEDFTSTRRNYNPSPTTANMTPNKDTTLHKDNTLHEDSIHIQTHASQTPLKPFISAMVEKKSVEIPTVDHVSELPPIVTY